MLKNIPDTPALTTKGRTMSGKDIKPWWDEDREDDKCAICGSSENLTKHHLVPRVKCHNKYRQIENDDENIVMLCRSCHDAVHAAYSENELRDSYSTVEKLLAAPEIAKYAAWKKKHPDFKGHAKMSNRRKS